MNAEIPLVVDMVSDLVCPWCYIGKRKLESALAMLRDETSDVDVKVRWHPFELNPQLPSAHQGLAIAVRSGAQ